MKATVTPADGHSERDAALVMIEGVPGRYRITVAGDKGYDSRDFVANLRAMRVTPHVAQHTTDRRSAVDGRVTRHAGYAILKTLPLSSGVAASFILALTCLIPQAAFADFDINNPSTLPRIKFYSSSGWYLSGGPDHTDNNIGGYWDANDSRHAFPGHSRTQRTGANLAAVTRDGVGPSSSFDFQSARRTVGPIIGGDTYLSVWFEGSVYRNGNDVYVLYHDESANGCPLGTRQGDGLNYYVQNYGQPGFDWNLMYASKHPRIGVAKSTNNGATWVDLGIILENQTDQCNSYNRWFAGGVGDPSWVEGQDGYLYILYTDYGVREAQGISLARLALADINAPTERDGNGETTLSRAQKWNDGSNWTAGKNGASTPIVAAQYDVHPTTPGATMGWWWGASVHRNTNAGGYVILMNWASDVWWNADPNNGWKLNADFKHGVTLANFNNLTSFAPIQDLRVDGRSWYPAFFGTAFPDTSTYITQNPVRFFQSGGYSRFEAHILRPDQADPAGTPVSTVTWASSWITCANEGGTCSFSGTKQVRYGANGSYFYQTKTNGTACTSSEFGGDPIYGVAKQCAIEQAEDWIFCANEWGTCSFSGTTQVRYGANGSYFYQTKTNGTTCTNSEFGGDPIYGVAKQCAIQQAEDWIFCANEWGTCAFSGTKEVRFGENGSYAYQTVTDGTPCHYSVFGDPLPGVAKKCWFRGAGGGGPSPNCTQATSITDTSGNIWSLGSAHPNGLYGYETSRNGAHVGDGYGNQYFLVNGVVYVVTSYGPWWFSWNGSGWSWFGYSPPACPINQLPTVSLTVPADGAAYTALATITIGADASDAEGAVSRVDFYYGSTLIASDAAAPFTIDWHNVPAGSYSLVAIAVDTAGATTTSAPRTVTVNNPPAERHWNATFEASTDHDLLVNSYLLDIFPAGADPATSPPIASQNLGKPAVVDGDCTAEVTATIGPLAPGAYQATVSAVGIGGTSRSAPITFVR